MFDIIIIGAGPAGLTAAIYARRASKKVLVLEANTYGGQILNANDIENYPVEPHISGFDFSNRLYNQVIDLKADVKFEKVIDIENSDDIKKVITKNNVYEAKTVIIATGSSVRKLGLENEEKLIGKGVSYCATCDGAFFRGRSVAVQGGGNTAIEDALYLSDIASKVYLIHRRDGFRADELVLNKLKQKRNVEFILNSSVTKLNAKDNLESIEITNQNGEKKVLDVSALFIAIGRIPENNNFTKFVDVDNTGYFLVDESCKTKTDGIFVAGDNRKKELRQLVTATSDGAVAAMAAIKFINGKIKR